MNRALKILLIAVGVIIGLFIIAAIALPLLFNPNNYRQQLTDLGSKQLNRPLSLGDIKLSVFPWLEVKVGDVSIANAPGFGSGPFAQIKELDIGVKLLPLLFDRKVETSTLTLDGLRLNLARNAKGDNNWADIGKSSTPPPATTPAENGGAAIDMNNISISGIEVDDAAVSYDDAQNGKHYSVDKLNLKTGTLHDGKPFDVNLTLTLSATAPQVKAAITLNGAVMADTSTKIYHVSDMKLAMSLSGAAVPGGAQDVTLGGDLDFNQASGAMKFSKGELQAAGLTLDAEITGANLLGDAPSLSGPITVKSFSPRNIMSKLGMTAPITSDRKALTDASLSAQYAGTFKSAMLNDVKLKLDQTSITGNLGMSDFATQAIRFALKADQLDADAYMAPKPDKAVVSDGGTKKSDINAIRIPTGALDALNIDGTADVGTLKISGLKLSDVHLKIAGTRGKAKQQTLTARLYGGQIVQSSRFGGGKSYAMQTQLKTIDAGPLLKDFLGKDYVSGIGSVDMDVTSAGDTVGSLRKALNGTVRFNLQNGAVKGFNLGQIIRGARALMAGQQLSAADNAQKETDFASLSASGKITNGILKSDDLDARSPIFRLAGAGQIDLVNDTLDYLAKPTIVETSSGQGGKDLADLRGLTIPIQLSGTFSAPKYKLQLDDLLKQKAAGEIQKQLDKHKDEINKKLGGQLGDALSKLLGGQQNAAPAPAATEPQK
ncbi:MAG TPA: AsmA family protein [Stenotrophobium sp.]|nr:AsmA family protein [Stenotrophobium sp.]